MSLPTKFFECLARLIEKLIQKLSPEESDVTESAPPARFNLHVQVNRYIAENEDGEEDEITERWELAPNPSEAIIREKALSVDWTDAERRPTIALAHGDDGKVHNLRIKGTLTTPNIDGAMRVYWLGPRNGDVVYVRSPPLDNLDQGIELLLTFLHDEQRLMAIVDNWEMVESLSDID